MKRNRLYLVERTDDWSYDETDAFIVCARNEEEALNTYPYVGEYNTLEQYKDSSYSKWTKSKDSIKVTELGIANPDIELGVILESFNAG